MLSAALTVALVLWLAALVLGAALLVVVLVTQALVAQLRTLTGHRARHRAEPAHAH